MRKVTQEEYKKALVELLKYVDGVCRENNIKYSLFGGTLIGAIRHKGIIPWDDDIDIILMNDEYEKLIKALKEKNSNANKFFLMDNDTEKTYIRPFAKVINTDTTLEEDYVKKVDNYGIYLDIFKYNYVPNNKFLRKIHYHMFWCEKTLMTLSTVNKKYKNLYKKLIVSFAQKISSETWLKMCNKRFDRYKNKKNNKYIMSNWPAYGYKHEIQLASDFNEFIDTEFEGIKIMVSKEYDNILKTTFGDYMTPPPEDKRIAHDNEAYWKNN